MAGRDQRRVLVEQLEIARSRGLLGPGPVEAHLAHGEAMATAIEADFDGRLLDLGSGAGVPGLILLTGWPSAAGVLLDARHRRCRFLEAALRELDLLDRASVACGRAEELARDPSFRGRFELVVARGFGRPATTAECAVGFLAPGGRLVVSEPPGEPRRDRWPEEGLAELGLRGPEERTGGGAGVAVLAATGPVAPRWPRRAGVPGRRPLW
ncbi:MAG TPA: RsmG family class I SAM-dependent methyltransferase [Candidatus Nitrosopolaris sp.]|nr:RsmG family class I SAM-dependent methyltransferase [Candidatus Nitrosopolaris sp.]